MDSAIPLLTKPEISSFLFYEILACFCDGTGRFESDMVGNQIVGFLTHRLLLWFPVITKTYCSPVKVLPNIMANAIQKMTLDSMVNTPDIPGIIE